MNCSAHSGPLSGALAYQKACALKSTGCLPKSWSARAGETIMVERSMIVNIFLTMASLLKILETIILLHGDEHAFFHAYVLRQWTLVTLACRLGRWIMSFALIQVAHLQVKRRCHKQGSHLQDGDFLKWVQYRQFHPCQKSTRSHSAGCLQNCSFRHPNPQQNRW